MKKLWMTAMAGFLMLVFCMTVSAQTKICKCGAAQDLLIKSEVETAISLLGAIHARQQKGEMTPEKARELGANLLRELRYGKDGYFWADTNQGVNVVLYGRQDVEGRNRLNDRDVKGVYYVQELLAKGKAGGGYVDYHFTKKGQTVQMPKRSYVMPFQPFGWVIGTGYYR